LTYSGSGVGGIASALEDSIGLTDASAWLFCSDSMKDFYLMTLGQGQDTAGV
jgi:hypothetical protein